MRKWIRRIVYGIAAVVVLFELIYWVQLANSRRALLAYESSLRAKGEKLTWAELDIHSSTNEEDLRFGREFATNDFPKLQHYPYMRAMVAPGAARVAWQQRENWEGYPSLNAAVNFTNWDGMENEAKDYAARLSVFREILKHPAPDFGVHTNHPAFLDPYFDEQKLLQVARGFATTIICDLHRGRSNYVISNLDALIGAADVNRNEPNQQGFRIAIGNLAVQATWEALQEPKWRDSQLSLIQAHWESMEFASAIQDTVLHGRVGVVELANYLADSKNTNRAEQIFSAHSLDASAAKREEFIGRYLVMPYYMAFAFNDDMLFLLKYHEAQVEMVRSLDAGEPWPPVKSALDGTKDGANKWLQERSPYRFWESRVNIGIDALPGLFHRMMELETERRMAVTAIALRRYEIRHGQFPANLDAVVPEFLTKVPTDPMTGTDLCYRLRPDGTFLLYSSGTDGRDDGGDPTFMVISESPNLWDGRDAVWPAPATDAQITKGARLIELFSSEDDRQ